MDLQISKMESNLKPLSKTRLLRPLLRGIVKTIDYPLFQYTLQIHSSHFLNKINKAFQLHPTATFDQN